MLFCVCVCVRVGLCGCVISAEVSVVGVCECVRASCVFRCESFD